MTVPLFIQLMVGGLIGMAIHVFAVKLPGHKQKCVAGNVPFSVGGYFKADWIAIVAAFLCVLGVVYAIDEVIKAAPKVQDYLKVLMIAVGFSWSSLFIALLGRATAAVMKIIDVKTDVADGKI